MGGGRGNKLSQNNRCSSQKENTLDGRARKPCRIEGEFYKKSVHLSNKLKFS